MASLRDVKQKIATVKNINKITQAMKMVAAARLRKAQEKVDAARPYAEKMRELLVEVVPQVPAMTVREQPLLQSRAGHRIGVVVLTSDRGLCGSYNNNVIREAMGFMRRQQEAGKTVELVTIGRRGSMLLKVRGFPPSQQFLMVGVDADQDEVRLLTEVIVGMYTRREDPVSEVYIVYGKFINAVTQQPTVDRFLPIEAGMIEGLASGASTAEQTPEEESEPTGLAKVAASPAGQKLQRYFSRPAATDGKYELDPSAEALLAVLLPRYVDNQVYQYLLEAIASEYGARMTAMSKASDNAAEMIDTLTLAYNRARQDAITKELLDIVGGASALAAD